MSASTEEVACTDPHGSEPRWGVYPFSKKEEKYMKNRIKQRANRKLKLQEERLDKRNNCGVKDLTPYNAVQQIRTKGKAEIALR
jgi:hypothetical protein